MLNQSFVKSHFFGREYIWWVGQIASEVSWKDNITGVPEKDNKNLLGMGERYRVAIMGYQPFDRNEVTDDELLWGYVEYPVTAGSGGRSSGASSNLAQGDIVRGYWLDGDEAQIPIITAVLGRNEYQDIAKNNPENVRFVPYSGFLPDDYVPFYAQRSFDGGDFFSQKSPEGNGGILEFPGSQVGKPNNDKVTESVTASNSTIELASECASEELSQPIAESEDCESIPIGRIQKQIQNLIIEIRRIQKSIYTYNAAAKNQIGEYQKFIDEKINKAIRFVSGGLKWVFLQIEKNVINTVNMRLKETYFFLFPNERPGLKLAVDNINDLIACLFRRLIGSLLELVGKFIKDALKKVIDAGQCLAENFISAIIGSIIRPIQDIINGALSDITSLINTAASIGSDIFNLIVDVLSFLSCDDKPKCSSINEWNILSGGGKLIQPDIESIKNKIGNISLDNIFSTAGCNIGPKLLGPPNIDFIGGEGAQGNAIISSDGELLGVDIVNPGINFTTDAIAKVVDIGGKGKGAVITPVVGTVIDSQGREQTGVVDVIVNESGTGYLPIPNGSTGAGGFTFSEPEDTVVKRSNGDFETPLPPGNLVTVNTNDEVTLPPTTRVITEPINNGEGGGEEIVGGNTVVVKNPGVFTSPEPNFEEVKGDLPILSTGTYPVILYLGGVIVEESGINYNAGNNPIIDPSEVQNIKPSIDSQGRPINNNLGNNETIFEEQEIDTNETPDINLSEGASVPTAGGDVVIIEPNNGAVVEPKFDGQGRVISVKVIEGGEGFTEIPKIFIKSETGFNAVLRPKLNIDRIGVDELKTPTIRDKVVNVVDCVGKF